MRVSSTLMSWSNENKSCMRVDKRELTSESWQARVYMRVSSTLISWSNENKSCMSVDKREFTWEFHQLSCPSQTRTRVAWELTRESLHESFINSHALVKQKQELHESWQASIYKRVSSAFMSLLNENKSCMRVDKWEFHQHIYSSFHSKYMWSPLPSNHCFRHIYI